MPTNIWKNSGEKNNLILWTLSSESEPGNTDNCQLSKESTDQPDQTKPEDWDTKLNKDTSSIELESEEVEERDQSLKVSLPESQPQLVSINLKPPETSDQRLKVELDTLWED